jgi:hypothetical protein
MVSLGALWLPILVSSVVVFVASSLVWMVLPHHRSDWKALPGEDAVLEAMRRAGVGRGQYRFPYVDPRDKSPEMQKRWQIQPMGTTTIWPAGRPNMGKQLGSWFLYLLFISICLAYLAGVVLPVGTAYRTVFRVVGTAAVLAYGGALLPNAIWWGRSWSTTLKEFADAVAYGLLTAGVFGWLWPR